MQVYDLVVITPAFLAGGTWTQRGLIQNAYGQRYDKRLSFLQNLAIDGQVQNRSLWANLSASACEDYQTYESDRGSVLLVTQGNHTRNTIRRTRGLDTLTAASSLSNRESTVLKYEFQPALGGGRMERYISDRQHPIAYCLSLKVPGRCRLQIHLWLFLTAVTLNVVKLACFWCTFKQQRGTPLMTLGDAVASFLSRPCPASNGMCLLSEEELIGVLKKREEGGEVSVGAQPRKFRLQQWRYYHSVSFIRWATYATSYVPTSMSIFSY